MPPKQLRGAEAEAPDVWVVLQVCIGRGLGDQLCWVTPAKPKQSLSCPCQILLTALGQWWALGSSSVLSSSAAGLGSDCKSDLVWAPFAAVGTLRSPAAQPGVQQLSQGHALGWAAPPPCHCQHRRAAQRCHCKALGDSWHSLLTA